MKIIKNIGWMWLMVIVCASACRKEEFMPEPQGEKVPYTGADSTLQQMLAGPGYGLFAKAWQKSNMNAVLASWGSNTMYTLLVPGDDAMRAAGLDDAGIGSASKETLDSMLMFHTVIGAIDNRSFTSLPASVGVRTMLVNPVFSEPLNPPGSAVKYDSVYRYHQYLAVKDQQLLVSGRVAGNAAPVYAKNGTIWKISRVLKPARKNMRQLLEGDPRFTLYVAALQLAEKTYETIDGLDALSQPPFMFYNTTLNTSKAEIDWDCYCNALPFGLTERNSIFAPTNEAFEKVGLRTVDDIRALNDRYKPVFDFDISILKGRSPLDSLLYMNTWGRQRSFYVLHIPPVFYNNDLIPEIMNGFGLKPLDYYAPPVPSPLEFSKDANGRIQVQWKGSGAEKATIIEADIETIQGPVHVIDRLIVPPGFHF